MAVLVEDDAPLEAIDEALAWASQWTHRDMAVIDDLLDARLERAHG